MKKKSHQWCNKKLLEKRRRLSKPMSLATTQTQILTPTTLVWVNEVKKATVLLLNQRVRRRSNPKSQKVSLRVLKTNGRREGGIERRQSWRAWSPYMTLKVKLKMRSKTGKWWTTAKNTLATTKNHHLWKRWEDSCSLDVAIQKTQPRND